MSSTRPLRRPPGCAHLQHGPARAPLAAAALSALWPRRQRRLTAGYACAPSSGVTGSAMHRQQRRRLAPRCERGSHTPASPHALSRQLGPGWRAGGCDAVAAGQQPRRGGLVSARVPVRGEAPHGPHAPDPASRCSAGRARARRRPVRCDCARLARGSRLAVQPHSPRSPRRTGGAAAERVWLHAATLELLLPGDPERRVVFEAPTESPHGAPRRAVERTRPTPV